MQNKNNIQIKRVDQVLSDNAPAKGHSSLVRAFTLIELLVVVLIIGVLAAVAVSQYQKAVDKAGFVQSWTTAQAIGQAQEIYYLTHGYYADSLDELDIDVSNSPSRILLKKCSESEPGGISNAVYVYHPKLTGLFLLWAYSHQCSTTASRANATLCYAPKKDQRANALCALMTQKPVLTLSESGDCNAGVHCAYFF